MAKKYLPELHRTVTETIKGKRVEKWIYPDKSYGICEDGKVTRYFPDGKIQIYNKEYDKDWDKYVFILAKESWLDGTQYRWYHDGRQSYEKLPNGTIRSWYENGQLELEKLPDGTEREYYPDGKLSRAKLPNNTLIEWEHYQKSYGLGGKIKKEKINNVLMREWHENGRLAYKRSPNGEEIRYDKLGKIIWHATNGVEDTTRYLELRRLAKRQAILMKEDLDMGDSQDDADWQLEICEKLRQKTLSKYEELAAASRAEIESDEIETPKTDENKETPDADSETPKESDEKTNENPETTQNSTVTTDTPVIN